VAGTYGINGQGPGADRRWAVDRLDTAAMIERARRARDAGAELVLAAVHAGTELRTAPSAQQVEVVAALTASGAFDFVYGHHAHVPQPWARVNGVPVMYGAGNLVAQMKVATPQAYESMLGRLTFEERADGWEVVRAEYVPLLMTLGTTGSPARVLPVNAALAAGTGDTARLELARDRVRRAATSLGADGLVEA